MYQLSLNKVYRRTDPKIGPQVYLGPIKKSYHIRDGISEMRWWHRWLRGSHGLSTKKGTKDKVKKPECPPT